MTCQDCSCDCTNDATYRITEPDELGPEWFYCDEHVPYLDPGVVVARVSEDVR